MTTYHKYNEPGIRDIIAATFPANRKDVAVDAFRGPIRCNSYWDGGSKDEYRLYDLDERRCYAVPSSHPYFDRRDDGTRCGILEITELPPNCVLAQGGYFLGKPATVRLSFRPENLAALLPAPAELPVELRQALNVIAGIKGGQYRRDEWHRQGLGEYSAAHPAVIELAQRGLVAINKAGAVAVTTAGRNAR